MAAGLGIGALVAVHLYTDTGLGALNLYSEQPREFHGADLEAARVVAAQASVVLAYTRKTQNLWHAIDTRNLIGQAQGMLMPVRVDGGPGVCGAPPLLPGDERAARGTGRGADQHRTPARPESAPSVIAAGRTEQRCRRVRPFRRSGARVFGSAGRGNKRT
jgi:hypothetical protein